MRKREIHSVAHWLMMTILLMFPIIMVALSGLGNSKYGQSYVQDSSLITSDNAYQVGATYQVNYVYDEGSTTYTNKIYYSSISFDPYDYGFNTAYNYIYFRIRNDGYLYLGDDVNPQQAFQIWGTDITSFTYTANAMPVGSNDWNIGSARFYLLSYKEVTLDYRSDINSWINTFIDLPINSWYKSLMNVIGVGFTNSTVMNVIYVMPVYILWVFIFDVIVDCFLVIIKLPHKLLNRLSGGENE